VLLLFLSQVLITVFALICLVAISMWSVDAKSVGDNDLEAAASAYAGN
jgi:hypothetical protein